MHIGGNFFWPQCKPGQGRAKAQKEAAEESILRQCRRAAWRSCWSCWGAAGALQRRHSLDVPGQCLPLPSTSLRLPTPSPCPPALNAGLATSNLIRRAMGNHGRGLDRWWSWSGHSAEDGDKSGEDRCSGRAGTPASGPGKWRTTLHGDSKT